MADPFSIAIVTHRASKGKRKGGRGKRRGRLLVQFVQGGEDLADARGDDGKGKRKGERGKRRGRLLVQFVQGGEDLADARGDPLLLGKGRKGKQYIVNCI